MTAIYLLIRRCHEKCTERGKGSPSNMYYKSFMKSVLKFSEKTFQLHECHLLLSPLSPNLSSERELSGILFHFCQFSFEAMFVMSGCRSDIQKTQSLRSPLTHNNISVSTDTTREFWEKYRIKKSI